MKTSALLYLALLTSGCAGMKVRVFDSAAQAPRAIAILPLTLDRFTPRGARHERSVGAEESVLLAESVRAVGVSVVEPKAAEYNLGGTVTRATVDEWQQFAFTSSFVADRIHISYVHYQLDLRLTDRSGRLVASLRAETDDGDAEALGRTMRSTLRQLMETLHHS